MEFLGISPSHYYESGSYETFLCISVGPNTRFFLIITLLSHVSVGLSKNFASGLLQIVNRPEISELEMAEAVSIIERCAQRLPAYLPERDSRLPRPGNDCPGSHVSPKEKAGAFFCTIGGWGCPGRTT